MSPYSVSCGYCEPLAAVYKSSLKKTSKSLILFSFALGHIFSREVVNKALYRMRLSAWDTCYFTQSTIE
ncbi:MAG: hypothetical protein CL578_04190 [Alteromonadaceae bacterium]|nr:hypothetical protein [Alteromonadaceae bacterium]